MNTTILVVGKTTPPWLVGAVSEYVERLSHYMDVQIKVVQPAGNVAAAVAVEKEGEALLSRISPKDKVILLDEKGKEYTSKQLADFFGKLSLNGVSSVSIVTGGAYGVSQSVRDRADFVISFSKFTFTHQMIRLLLVEQLYRAMTILHGRPYHND